MLTNENFFDTFSEYYDSMISFQKLLGKKTNILASFINDGVKSAADLGCGTGVDSIALVNNGLEVTGFDISKGMIEKAKENSKALNADIKFQNYAIQEIPRTFDNNFDFAISLGNSLANLDEKQLYQAFERVYNILKDKGKFLIQILNYDYVIEQKERIVNITQDEQSYFIRFYDFNENDLNFNILSFKKENPAKRDLITTKIYPHKKEIMVEGLKKAGFKNISLFGDLSTNEFDAGSSKNLVTHCQK
jgi:ubiquinone/menaquinone biosynthesis C-methylase UbiE